MGLTDYREMAFPDGMLRRPRRPGWALREAEVLRRRASAQEAEGMYTDAALSYLKASKLMATLGARLLFAALAIFAWSFAGAVT